MTVAEISNRRGTSDIPCLPLGHQTERRWHKQPTQSINYCVQSVCIHGKVDIPAKQEDSGTDSQHSPSTIVHPVCVSLFLARSGTQGSQTLPWHTSPSFPPPFGHWHLRDQPSTWGIFMNLKAANQMDLGYAGCSLFIENVGSAHEEGARAKPAGNNRLGARRRQSAKKLNTD